MTGAPHPTRKAGVDHVIGWTTALVVLLLLVVDRPLLPDESMPVRIAIGIGAGVVTFVVLSRLWTSWHVQPSRLGRVVAGVVAGLLLAVAYGEALRPNVFNAAMALLIAGAFVFVGAQSKDAD